MGRFVYNNTLKPYETGMPDFIPEHSMESGGEEKFWSESKYTANVLKWLFGVGRVCAGIAQRHVLYL